MNTYGSQSIPWPTRTLMQAANDTVAVTIGRHRASLQPSMDLAGRIRQRIATLDGPMDHLCRHTCPRCTDICCLHAHVYFDFKDLLFLHLGDGMLSERQPIEKVGQTCRHWASSGCRLPRIHRPFMCTWYLCPQQRSQLDTLPPSSALYLQNSLKALKKGRRQLEADYIHVTAGPCSEPLH